MCIKYLDRQLERFAIRHQKRININSTPTRWGFLAVLSTISLGFCAVSFSLFALYQSWNTNVIMVDVIIVAAVITFTIGVLAGIVFIWIGFYFLRRQYSPTETESDITTIRKAVDEKIPKTLNNLNTKVGDISSKLDTITEKLETAEKQSAKEEKQKYSN